MCITRNYDEAQIIPVILSTDGSHAGSSGGWAYVKRVGQRISAESGFCAADTSTQAEIEAIYQALLSFPARREIILRVDSVSVIRVVRHLYGDMSEYLRRSEWNAIRAEISEELPSLLRMHQITFFHVKGHAGDADNELCDKLAGQAMRRKIHAVPLVPAKKEPRAPKRKIFRPGSLDHLLPDGRLPEAGVKTVVGAPPREFPRRDPVGIAWALTESVK